MSFVSSHTLLISEDTICNKKENLFLQRPGQTNQQTDGHGRTRVHIDYRSYTYISARNGTYASKTFIFLSDAEAGKSSGFHFVFTEKMRVF